jgi:hypothetical protein
VKNLLGQSTLIGLALVLANICAVHPAGAAVYVPPAVVVEPGNALVEGQSITVSLVGVPPTVMVGFAECNDAPFTSEPFINDQPVGCTRLQFTQANSVGVAQMTFVVRTGVIGPPALGTDTAGNDAATDAQNYPCPPLPSDGCRIIGAWSGGLYSQQIGFQGTPGGAALSFSPVSGPRGTLVRFDGIGVPKGKLATVYYRNLGNAVALCHGYGDSSSRWTCTGAIRPGATIGLHKIRLGLGTAGATTLALSAFRVTG